MELKWSAVSRDSIGGLGEKNEIPSWENANHDPCQLLFPPFIHVPEANRIAAHLGISIPAYWCHWHKDLCQEV